MRLWHLIAPAMVALVGTMGSAPIADSAAANEVVINGAAGERGAPIQYQKSATCTDDSDGECAVVFNPVPANRRFEIRYLNCRFDGPYQVFQANLAIDTPTPLILDLPPERAFSEPHIIYTTFTLPVEIFVAAGRRATITVQMIGSGGTAHLRCLISGNLVTLP